MKQDLTWWTCLRNLKNLFEQVQGLMAWKEIQTLKLEDEVDRLRSERDQARKEVDRLMELLKVKMTPPVVSVAPMRARDAVMAATKQAFEEN